LLRACLAGDEPPVVDTAHAAVLGSAPAVESLPALADYHRVGPWVRKALGGHPALSPEVADELAAQERDGMALHLAAMSTLARVAGPLDAVGGRWVVFKGPALAKLVYRRPELRPYGDLDVLVDRTRFADSIAALEEVGFQLVEANWPLISAVGAGEVFLENPTLGGVDLHWHVHFERTRRQAFPIPVAEMLARSRPARLGTTVVHTFDPVDTMLHLCVHAAGEGADRLLWLKDLEQVARREDVDWEELVHRARQWGVRLPVAVVLSRARAALEARVPAEVLEALAPHRTWRWLATGIDRAFPVATTRGEGSPATLLARSARSGEWSSAFIVTRGAAQRARRLVASGSWRRARPSFDPDDPASFLHSPVGADRTEFLEWVRIQRD
jgi:hypothetical protein